MEGLLPCDLFYEEDEYENDDKYNLDHVTGDEDSLMSVKDVEEESWNFMENPIYGENNEPETLDGFVDSPVYGISKGEKWTLWPWKILIWKRSMQYIHMISLSHISLSVRNRKIN